MSQMTESRQRVNSRHAVRMPPAVTPANLQLYDFATHTYRPAVFRERLPYDLVTVQFADMAADDDACLVTAQDSYLLLFEGDIPQGPEAMSEAQAWRLPLVGNKAAEFEYKFGQNRWVCAAPSWWKADIVPGVVIGGLRECPNFNGFGYRHIDSRRFAEKGTHCTWPTQAELEIEEADKAKTRQGINRRKEIVATLPRVTAPEHAEHAEDIFALDLRAYLASLKCGGRIGAEELRALAATTNPDLDVDALIAHAFPEHLALYGCILTGADWCWAETTLDMQGQTHQFIPNTCDGLFDLWVGAEATYARLVNSRHLKFDFVRREDDGTWRLPYATLDNTIQLATSGAAFAIETDGRMLYYKVQMIAFEPRLVTRGAGSHMLCRMDDMYLFNGHIWAPSFVTKTLIPLP